ncbi:MAG: choline/carnitine O-acyltransferase [Defluviitaleaceae bacterium]|nr:choline/carnitine O-acyltransferase [Defluviitaleaceae bacterium]
MGTQHEYTLPELLPLPGLEQTIEKYLERVRPLVTQAEYDAAEQKARRFAEGGGRSLHGKLEEFAKSAPGSWLTGIWLNKYLAYRGELSSNMNYLTTLDTTKIPRRGSFAEFAAALVSAFTKVYVQSAGRSLPQESGRSGPLCMEQYKYAFGACRIPRPEHDELYVGDRSLENAHVIILCHENIYTLAVTGADGAPLSIAGLSKGIAQILESGDAPSPNVGTMTAAPREDAAKLYQRLCGLDARNSENFGLINKALFALCIDHAGERSLDKSTFDKLYGYGKNRWFDKCFQLIVGTDYTVGFNNEHTAYDAAVWMSILQNAYGNLAGEDDGAGAAAEPAALRIEWTTDQAVLDAIQNMEEIDMARGKTILLRTSIFDSFGSSGIKELKSSPDAFFHLALQMAWFRQNGRLDSTYEAVSMRQYHQGRTECMRPSTTAVLDFVLAYRDGLAQEDLERLARAAFDLHVGMIGQCQAGNGPERHLTGLQAMAAMNGVTLNSDEDIFADSAYVRLKHDTISSSGLGAKGLELFAFGPVVDDGFGVGYVIDSDSIRLCISCMEQSKDKLEPFVQDIGTALRDLRGLLQK